MAIAPTRLLLPLLLACIASRGSAQQTVVVQGGGQAFAQAVAAAAHGDTLLVRPGTYDSTAITVGIKVLCDPGVVFQNLGLGFAVRWVPAGRTFAMRGGVIQGTAALGPLFSVGRCAGSVRFEGVTLPGREDAVWESVDVAFHDCTTGPLVLTDSNVSFAGCSASQPAFLPVSPTLSVLGGDVTLHGGTIRGADMVPHAPTFAPTPAILVHRGRLTLAGDAGTTIAAGRGALAAPAIVVDRDAGLWWNGSVTLVPNAGANPIEGSGTVLLRRLASVAITGLSSGQPMQLDLHSHFGSTTYVFASWPVTPSATPFGRMWVDPSSPVLFGGAVPASGRVSISIGIPPLPPGSPLVVQPLTFDASAQLLFGAPTAVVMN